MRFLFLIVGYLRYSQNYHVAQAYKIHKYKIKSSPLITTSLTYLSIFQTVWFRLRTVWRRSFMRRNNCRESTMIAMFSTYWAIFKPDICLRLSLMIVRDAGMFYLTYIQNNTSILYSSRMFCYSYLEELSILVRATEWLWKETTWGRNEPQ